MTAGMYWTPIASATSNHKMSGRILIGNLGHLRDERGDSSSTDLLAALADLEGIENGETPNPNSEENGHTAP
jgi:hypothetical protein